MMKAILSNKIKLLEAKGAVRDTLVERLQMVNPKWIENQRMGRWNRGTPKVLKYFRRSGADGLIIPRGYMRQLILLCRKHNEQLEIEDRRRKCREFGFKFHGALKPFQQKAVNAMAAKDFGTLSAPTGSGKTVMALELIARRKQPSLVIVHTKDLAIQWKERIHAFLKIPPERIGMIGAGKKEIGGGVTVAMVQSLYKCARDVAPHVGQLVVDECHRAPSRTFTEAVTAFDAQYMLGLSATPWRRDRLSKLIFWHLGDMHYEISKAHLVEKGHILDIEVIYRNTDFKPYYDPVNEYSKMLSELTGDDDRNRMIARDIAGEIENGKVKGICLVLSDRKHHCENLQAILKHRHHIHAAIITGDVSIGQRREVIDHLKRGQARVLIATGQLIGEGFDHPGLSTLFLTTPVRFSGRVLQYLGRVLRPTKGVQRARVYDYIDIHVQPLVAAARARQRVYESQK